MNNYIIAYIIVAVVVLSSIVYINLKESWQSKIKSCLLYFVLKAEKELGSETGIVKRSLVYGLVKEKFPKIMIFISIETFDKILDETLKEMEKLLSSNKDLLDKLN